MHLLDARSTVYECRYRMINVFGGCRDGHLTGSCAGPDLSGPRPTSESFRSTGNLARRATMTHDSERLRPTTLVLDEVHENPTGRDGRHLDDEFVTLKNEGETPLDLSGWTVGDEAGAAYRFPDGTSVGPGDHLILRSGTGDDTATTRYWGSTTPVWANLGDTVVVRDAAGRVRIRYSYNE